LNRPKKLSAIEGQNEAEKELRPSGHRSVELHFGVCLQQNVYAGVGSAKKFTEW